MKQTAAAILIHAISKSSIESKILLPIVMIAPVIMNRPKKMNIVRVI